MTISQLLTLPQLLIPIISLPSLPCRVLLLDVQYVDTGARRTQDAASQVDTVADGVVGCVSAEIGESGEESATIAKCNEEAESGGFGLKGG